ncbi:MAG TPA: AEC family transporter, partial [Alphaproteobacteria bacterium]|nr:AEC family transporter [Alphaproteobacteria bacterium]
MLSILLALAPVFLLIFLGHGLKRWQFLADPFWVGAER